MKTPLSPEAEKIHDLLFDGYTPLPVFAEANGIGDRQSNTWVNQGLPCIKVGRRVYVDLARARPWLLKLNSTPPEVPAKRGPGRPRKAVAAR
jgi:hypothetical protein